MSADGGFPRDPLLAALELFVRCARSDVYAVHPYRSGPVRQPLTMDLLGAHLAGTICLGAYIMQPGTDTTRLAVLDFDNHKGELSWEQVCAIALRVIAVARRYGLEAWALRSGGGLGLHLCFRWDEPQQAAAVRALMERILAEAGLRSGAGGGAKGEVEIFPKQDRLGPDDFGNLIAVPFARRSVPLDAEMQPRPAPRPWLNSAPVPSIAPREEKKPATKRSTGPFDMERLRDALTYLRPLADDYSWWIKFGFAIKVAFGDAGFDIWNEWSIESGNYPE
jgi:hypothetical protein